MGVGVGGRPTPSSTGLQKHLLYVWPFLLRMNELLIDVSISEWTSQTRPTQRTLGDRSNPPYTEVDITAAPRAG